MKIIKYILQITIGPFWSSVYSIPRIVRGATYYPELKRKSLLKQYYELVLYRFRHQCVNIFYKAYGLDRVGAYNSAQYLDEKKFWSCVVSLNYRSCINHAIILRDKYLFFVFMKAHGIPTPDVVARVNNGSFFVGHKRVSFNEWLKFLIDINQDLFLKEACSCCARGVRKIKKSALKIDKDDFSKDDKYIIQRALTNCEGINRIQSKSVNTLRIVTINSPKTGKIELLSPGGLRIGGGGDVDNWAQGGLFVGIDKDGLLEKYGYYKPGKHNPCKSEVHPTTGFKFEGYKVPFYKEAIDLVIKAHSCISEIVSIGWDVALTPEGPCLIEGNDDYEISLMQMVAGGLKNRYKELGVI